MGVVASLAISPILIEVARDEEIREIKRRQAERLKALPGQGFIYGDIDLNFVKKIKTSSPRHKHGSDCHCGCPHGDCKFKEFHQNVEKIYLTGELRPKYDALFHKKTPRTTLENNFFVQSGSKKYLKAYPRVALKRDKSASRVSSQSVYAWNVVESSRKASRPTVSAATAIVKL